MRPGAVLVVGDVINDVMVRTGREATRGSDTPSAVTWRLGGQGANQAAWLGFLGAPVRFAGRAGASDGERHASALESAGVDVRLSLDSERETGTIVVIVERGERSMFTDRGAGAFLGESDLPVGLLDGVAHLHVSGYTLFEEPGRSAVRRLMRDASARGLGLSVDPSSVTWLREVGTAAFFDWTAGTALLFPNMDEGRSLAGEDAPGAVLDCLLAHYGEVALKLGSGGAVCGTRSGDRVEVPAEEGPLVDTTGAGDAFAAGYLSARLRGEAMLACAHAATRASQIVVSRLGARPPV